MMTIYVGSQMASTLLMPTSLDKTQRYIFLALPLVFAVVIVNQTFPAGLLIYWITTNLWTVGQALDHPHLLPATPAREPEGGQEGQGAAATAQGQAGQAEAEARGPGRHERRAPQEEAPTAGTGASASKKRKGDRVRQRDVRRPAKPDRPRGQPGSQPGGSGAEP